MSHITIIERREIYEKRLLGVSFYQIGKDLKRPTKTIIAEYKRNKVATHGYEPIRAQEQVDRRKSKPRVLHKFSNPAIKDFVVKALEDDFSPEQISGRIESEIGFKVSHETIYSFVYRDKQEGGQLYKHLRRCHKKRKPRLPKTNKSRIKNSVSITERPKVVDEKSRFGDLELDTVEGKKGSGFFVTVVDKATKKLWARFIPNKTSENTRKAILEMLSGLKIKTLTSDNGSEFACHQEISEKLAAKFYFARPYSSWERGLNEHTNGLLRQYFPKKTVFDQEGIEEKLIEVVAKINRRPRKSLNFKTPDEAFSLLAEV
jgi:IS30 family transposase